MRSATARRRVQPTASSQGHTARRVARALAERGIRRASELFANVLSCAPASTTLVSTRAGGKAPAPRPDVDRRLAAEGIGPEDIDLMGSPTRPGPRVRLLDGEKRPVYRNATYVLSQDAWDFWSDEETVARLPERVPRLDADPARHPARGQVVGPGKEVVPWHAAHLSPWAPAGPR